MALAAAAVVAARERNAPREAAAVVVAVEPTAVARLLTPGIADTVVPESAVAVGVAVGIRVAADKTVVAAVVEFSLAHQKHARGRGTR